RPYSAGFGFRFVGTIFGIDLNTNGGARERSLAGFPFMDFYLSVTADLSKFNSGVVSWVKSIIPFDTDLFLKEGTSLCALACINSISLTEFSIYDMTQGKFPKFSISISIIGIRKDFNS